MAVVVVVGRLREQAAPAASYRNANMAGVVVGRLHEQNAQGLMLIWPSWWLGVCMSKLLRD